MGWVQRSARVPIVLAFVASACAEGAAGAYDDALGSGGPMDPLTQGGPGSEPASPMNAATPGADAPTTPGGDADAPATGLKCIYTRQGSWQEVFLVCDEADAARDWLEANC